MAEIHWHCTRNYTRRHYDGFLTSSKGWLPPSLQEQLRTRLFVLQNTQTQQSTHSHVGWDAELWHHSLHICDRPVWSTQDWTYRLCGHATFGCTNNGILSMEFSPHAVNRPLKMKLWRHLSLHVQVASRFPLSWNLMIPEKQLNSKSERIFLFWCNRH